MTLAKPQSILRTVLVLGRVSNLPTVWTNVFAGAALAGASLNLRILLPLAIAMSLLYVAGMVLNDAFDRGWDAQHRKERPIPAGLISATAVFVLGGVLMAAGVGIVGTMSGLGMFFSWRPFLATLALTGLILAYDLHHKKNALSPLLMGLCRVAVYITAGWTAGSPQSLLYIGAGLLLCHLIGLSYIAKHETKAALGRTWPVLLMLVPIVLGAIVLQISLAGLAVSLAYSVAVAIGVAAAVGLGKRKSNPRFAVPWLIASISLLDAMFLSASGTVALSFMAMGCFALTLLFQRVIPGT
ncbi:MAG: UbiA family prenyltransferase [Deltaproteobacteria bacterium]|nr:UbiA family prenyltransferase [Deltaproteobacteria bacterium]